MKQPIHRIFEETGCIRQDALIRYRDSELSDADKHDVERHLIDCELCTDALEGIALGVTAGYLDEVRGEVLENISGNTGTGSFSSSARWLIAAAVSAVVIMSIFTFLEFNKVEQEGVALHEERSHEVNDMPSNNETSAEVLPDNGASAPVKNDPAPSLADPPSEKKEQPVFTRQRSAPATVVIAEVEDEKISEEVGADEEIEDAVAYEEIAEADIAVPRSKEVPVTQLDSNKLLFSASGSGLASNPQVNNITYLNNYKVFSGSDLDKDGKLQSAELKSLSPRYENESAAKTADAPTVERKELTYEEALELALVDYDNQRYSEALDRLNLIENSKPDDLNVGFYSGMSNYNMSNYSEALKDLEPITKDKNGVFNEEAYYYSALCHYKTGNTHKGIRMLNDIANGGGFYADDARKFIETNR